MQPVARPYLDKGRIEVIEPTLADAQSTRCELLAEGGPIRHIALQGTSGGRIYAIKPGSGSNHITRKMIDDNRFGLGLSSWSWVQRDRDTHGAVNGR